MTTQMTTQEPKQSFDAFYRSHYLEEHRNPINRRIHFASNCGVLLSLALAAKTKRWEFLASAVTLQVIPPFLGHVLFEGSHQSIERSPLFSALGSWRMFFEIVFGKQRL